MAADTPLQKGTIFGARGAVIEHGAHLGNAVLAHGKGKGKGVWSAISTFGNGDSRLLVFPIDGVDTMALGQISVSDLETPAGSGTMAGIRL